MSGDYTETEVIVVGAGPVGLLLAGELRLAGADVVVLDKLTAPTTESRASTLHSRTMEILDTRGLLDALGEIPGDPSGHFGGSPSASAFPAPTPASGRSRRPAWRRCSASGRRTWAPTYGAATK